MIYDVVSLIHMKIKWYIYFLNETFTQKIKESYQLILIKLDGSLMGKVQLKMM